MRLPCAIQTCRKTAEYLCSAFRGPSRDTAPCPRQQRGKRSRRPENSPGISLQTCTTIASVAFERGWSVFTAVTAGYCAGLGPSCPWEARSKAVQCSGRNGVTYKEIVTLFISMWSLRTQARGNEFSTGGGQCQKQVLSCNMIRWLAPHSWAHTQRIRSRSVGSQGR